MKGGLLENASESMIRKSSLVIIGELFRGVLCIEGPSCETIEGQQGFFNRCLCVRTGKRHSKPWECGPSESSV